MNYNVFTNKVQEVQIAYIGGGSRGWMGLEALKMERIYPWKIL